MEGRAHAEGGKEEVTEPGYRLIWHGQRAPVGHDADSGELSVAWWPRGEEMAGSWMAIWIMRGLGAHALTGPVKEAFSVLWDGRGSAPASVTALEKQRLDMEEWQRELSMASWQQQVEDHGVYAEVPAALVTQTRTPGL
ncbi:hypothetical protein NDU88_005154 [Pleurodeles waltl]|uniref:Uncharacterized protein n=1 Tax=Pleurodeles waltl TaxID=8319 RepID=A0AAV7PLU2_PLEWA|nr:hypothetical protein NDU88_005154 [Pleurodeles waltl]